MEVVDARVDVSKKLMEEPKENLTEVSTEKNVSKFRFVCKSCPKIFKTKIRLKRHDDAVHKKLKPFGCLYCNKTFSTKESANQHSKAVHEEIKPHNCQHCSKLFSTKDNLEVHISTVHEGNKLFQCPICQKNFGLKGNLDKHIPTHSNEKPFMCPNLDCNSKFTLPKGLTRHTKTCRK